MRKALFPLLTVLLFAACKKSTNNTPATHSCVISSIQDSSKDLDVNVKTVLTYDVNGKLIRTAATGTQNTTRIFQYFGTSMITISVSQSGMISEIDTVTLNANGYIATLQRFSAGSPPLYITSSFYYGANNEVSSEVDYDSHGNVDSLAYSWANGDLLNSGDPFVPVRYTYDTTTAARDGDWFLTQQKLTYGALYAPTKHMIRSVGVGHNAPLYFFYTINDSARVVSYNTYIGSSVQVTTYHYTCK
ncbi:MAG: hypothetical protein H0X33_11890 [Taibaiella sp.]|nr:hypothetical protein [Taibaiella sp.]